LLKFDFSILIKVLIQGRANDGEGILKGSKRPTN
jgi:hypothetical protein